MLNHNEDEMGNSLYSSSLGAGGRTPASINGMGLAPITRTNTVSLNNHQLPGPNR